MTWKLGFILIPQRNARCRTTSMDLGRGTHVFRAQHSFSMSCAVVAVGVVSFPCFLNFCYIAIFFTSIVDSLLLDITPINMINFPTTRINKLQCFVYLYCN